MSDTVLSNTPGGNAGSSRSKTPWIIGGVIVVILAALVIWLVAKGGDDDKAGSGSSKLVVATEGTYAPFSYQENGKLTGYDIDVAKAVAKKAGLTFTFKQTQWDSIFAGIDAGRFDAVANEVTINDDRTAKYLMSTPYSVSTGVLVVAKDNTDITSFDDIKGHTAAQSLTSNWADEAKKAGAKIQPVNEWALAADAIATGRVDLAVNDKLAVLDYLKKNPDANIKIVATSPETMEQAFLLRKGKEADLEKINTALDALKSDGTLASIGEKYFGEDISK
ncbi:transporter substrate-binding domain-containing protein [Nocardioides sp. Kera G14]|uniref:transporter substrate-binding domain-containing protein n=1 Tax=Nocardioides sp. Kera G14 TaxID=2884264 RepID=UPI001D111B28|nr:transporter substrate-binding domain-containing protein [Nocardioides sp. Kera G14]UDY23171.1 transporter substrate-binding domain-containing protein [Nocardioides sp. Kera G14]